MSRRVFKVTVWAYDMNAQPVSLSDSALARRLIAEQSPMWPLEKIEQASRLSRCAAKWRIRRPVTGQHPASTGRSLEGERRTGVSEIQLMDLATATHVTLAAKSVTTMTIINGSNGGFPPQFLICTDSAPPVDKQTPCMVYAQ